MPHLTLEYSDNLPAFHAEAVLRQLNQTLLASGHFDALDIKSRALALDCFVIGEADDGHGFIHLRLAMLSGRSEEVKLQLSRSLLQTLQESSVWPATLQVQLCVEIQDIHRASYAKAGVGQ